jgi:hypothetical protein
MYIGIGGEGPEHTVTKNSVGDGGYTDPGKRRFRNASRGCVLLRKNLQNGVPARSVIKIPLGCR